MDQLPLWPAGRGTDIPGPGRGSTTSLERLQGRVNQTKTRGEFLVHPGPVRQRLHVSWVPVMAILTMFNHLDRTPPEDQQGPSQNKEPERHVGTGRCGCTRLLNYEPLGLQ